MRILQVMAGAEFGGAEAFFTRLALGLHRAGLEQRVVIRTNPRRTAVLRQGGVEPVELSFGGRMDLLTPRRLKRQIKDFAPDIVLTWMNRASRMCPKGGFVHVGRLGGYYDLKYYRSCDHLIGNTQDIVEYLTNDGWPAERAHYLPNFVSGEPAAPTSRNDFFTPKGAPLILAMGRMHENKAFDVLLEAMVQVSEVYLWLAGDGPLRGQLEALAERLGVKPRVRFLGWREDTAALLAACDIFVCPSRHEPLGNVVVEAWAQSRPVIAADSMGPGTLIDHMETGVLVPINDPTQMARTIRYVAEDKDLAERIARGGRAVYEQRFTEAAIVEQYLRFFERIVS